MGIHVGDLKCNHMFGYEKFMRVRERYFLLRTYKMCSKIRSKAQPR